MSPQDCLSECISKLSGPEEFYDLKHQSLYATLVDMYNRKIPIDLITLQNELKLKQQLDMVGGLAYLSTLPDAVPSAANLEYYLDIVRDKFILRQAINTCTAIAGRAYDYEGEVDALMDQVEQDILKIGKLRQKTETKGIATLIAANVVTIQEMSERDTQTTGLTTGFEELDRITTGLQNSDMIVLAARPGSGKTTIALNIADHVAINLEVPVGVFSLEMTADRLSMRMLAARSGVNMRKLSRGDLAEEAPLIISKASAQLSKAPIYFDDTSGLNVMQIRSRSRIWHERNAVRLIVIDYLQIVKSGSSRRFDNGEQELGDVCAGIKSIAKELNIPILVLAQLSREVDSDNKGKGRPPRLSDLRGSGQIEQHADIVCLLYKKPKKEDTEDDHRDGREMILDMAKQRDGDVGKIDLIFRKRITRFESAPKIDDSDIPQKPLI